MWHLCSADQHIHKKIYLPGAAMMMMELREVYMYIGTHGGTTLEVV
jgi:hypothetical protein